MNKIIFGTRRAVSETIATLLLLSITVVAAVMISSFVSDGFYSGLDQSPSSTQASADSIQLTGYDTRDSDNLINVVNLDNNFVNAPKLCAEGNDLLECTNALPDIDNIPKDLANPGTDFIALQLRNMSPDSVFLQNIQINNILHAWDTGTADNPLDATSSLNAGTGYPRAGFFSIIKSPDRPNNEIQFESQEVQGNEEVRVIIKLSENLSNIEMWDSMQIVVNFGGNVPADFIVTSGDAKW